MRPRPTPGPLHRITTKRHPWRSIRWTGIKFEATQGLRRPAPLLITAAGIAGAALTTPFVLPIALIAAALFAAFPRREARSRDLAYGPARHGDAITDARGYKLATVAVGRDGRIEFRGLVHGAYGADERATCTRGRTHTPPADDCHCGFHAFYTVDQALAHWSSYPDAVLLDVELYGDIVAHRRGWRAAEQVVMAAYVRPTCRQCGRHATGLSLRPPTNRRDVITQVTGHDRYIPTCDACTSRTPVTLAHLTGQVGTEIRWAW